MWVCVGGYVLLWLVPPAKLGYRKAGGLEPLQRRQIFGAVLAAGLGLGNTVVWLTSGFGEVVCVCVAVLGVLVSRDGCAVATTLMCNARREHTCAAVLRCTALRKQSTGGSCI